MTIFSTGEQDDIKPATMFIKKSLVCGYSSTRLVRSIDERVHIVTRHVVLQDAGDKPEIAVGSLGGNRPFIQHEQMESGPFDRFTCEKFKDSANTCAANYAENDRVLLHCHPGNRLGQNGGRFYFELFASAPDIHGSDGLLGSRVILHSTVADYCHPASSGPLDIETLFP